MSARARRPRTLALVVGLVVAAALVACGGGPGPVATLREGQGAVSRERGGREAPATPGTGFVVGDAARTGDASSARLALRGGAILTMGADTLVRFAPAGARLERGLAGAEAAPVTILTEAGPAVLEAGGVLRATADPRGARFEVVIGRAVLQGVDGAHPLEPGGHLVIAIGGAILEDVGRPPPPPTPPPPPPVATTATTTATVVGRGVTVQPASGPSRPLPAGAASLAAGDRVTLPRGTRLELDRGGDRVVVGGAAAVVVGGPDQPLVTLAGGTASLRARDRELTLAVPGGRIVAPPGSEATLTLAKAETTAWVERGPLTLDGDRTDATAATGETGVLTAGGEASVREPAPERIDLTLEPGATVELHDPGRKVAVAIDPQAACPQGGALELLGRGAARRLAGSGPLPFWASAGVTRYRVRCDDGATRAGAIRVVGDSGAAPVVRTAPATLVEADGRRWSVLYQNRVPQITIRWSEAKGATRLELTPAGGTTRTFSSATGTHVLPAGELDEGSYSLLLVAGARRSAPTTLRIAFDNAAPTAQITAPPPRAPWTDPLAVTGVAAEGWSVSVDGVAASRDASGRFRASVVTAGKDTIAIRLSHPAHGVLYYLRRRQ